MAKQSSGKSIDPFKKFGTHSVEMRIALNRINPALAYKVGNMDWLNEIKQGIRYENGETISELSEKMFHVAAMAELATTLAPSALLATNMAAAGDPKPVGETEAHHIVAFKAQAAHASRRLLFGWRIAINDKDNGVHLPAYKRSVVVSLPDAIKHRPIHTDVYHMAVFRRLDTYAKTDRADTAVGRDALKSIKRKILNGTFPYLREHQR